MAALLGATVPTLGCPQSPKTVNDEVPTSPTEVAATPTPEPTPWYDGTQAPTRLVARFHSDSRFDLGYEGGAHNQQFPGHSALTLEMTCASADPPFEVCNLSGPIAQPAAPSTTYDTRRCALNPRQTCTVDSECSVGLCVWFVSAPIPISGPGCMLTYYKDSNALGAVTGTANLLTGALELDNFAITARLYSAADPSRPCPVCENGTDGYTCYGGRNHGDNCTPHATHPLSPAGAVSFDCPPALGENMTGTGMSVTMRDLTVGPQDALKVWATRDSPFETNAGQSAVSGVCSTTTTIGCRFDTECPTGETCSAYANTVLSSCGGTETCTDAGDTLGVCTGNQHVGSCTLAPALPCSEDAICATPGHGTCAFFTPRPCFYSVAGGDLSGTVTARNELVSQNEVWVGAFFPIGYSTNGTVENLGIPGLGRLRLRIDPDLERDE